MAKGLNSVTFALDTSAFDELMKKVEDKANESVRPAAQAGADVIYEEAKRLAGRSTRPHYFYGTSWKKRQKGTTQGRYLFNPGDLKNAIYQVYSKDNSSETVATYHVSWNFEKSPYGLFVEYGLSPFTPKSRPFLRPALINKYAQAVEAMKQKISEKVKEL